MGIIKQLDKRTGITYVYESKAYWDKEKKQSRAKRTLIGRIDPETGDILDEPTEHTAAEFAAMLAAGGYPDFASDNVKVTFDDDGNMVRAERFYTPWQ